MKRISVTIVLSALALVGLIAYRRGAVKEPSHVQQPPGAELKMGREGSPRKPSAVLSAVSLVSRQTTKPSTADQSLGEKRCVIQVLDAETKHPIANAEVHVSLANNSAQKWKGPTDPQGVFAFTWRGTSEPAKAHIWITAAGYRSVDALVRLMEAKLFVMHKSV